MTAPIDLWLAMHSEDVTVRERAIRRDERRLIARLVVNDLERGDLERVYRLLREANVKDVPAVRTLGRFLHAIRLVLEALDAADEEAA